MNKKIMVAASALLGCVGVVMGYITFPFSTWPEIEQMSREIIVAKCTATPDPEAPGKDGVVLEWRGLVHSDIEVVSVLKGSTNSMPTHLLSEYMPRQGEYYLIFAMGHFEAYDANDKYRVVPLGTKFSTNQIAGRTLGEQVRLLLERRLKMLTKQMSEEAEEKKRLEEGLKGVF